MPPSTPRGATFPQAYYEAAIDAFKKEAPKITINYGGGGSGKGRQDLADQVIDFAGSDGPIKDEDLPKFKGGEVLYFPTVLAPITVSYNLSASTSSSSRPSTIAKIFQREITNWNDPAIAADNPGVTLPDKAITVGASLRRLGHHRELHQVPERRRSAPSTGWKLKFGLDRRVARGRARPATATRAWPRS